MRVNPELTESRRHAESLVVVGMPLPLLAHKRRIELVALNRVLYRPRFRRLWLAVRRDGVAAIVTVLVYTHNRPVVFPRNRLEMYYTAVTPFILEVQEPILAKSCMHPCTLMRPVNIALTLGQHNLALVRAIDIP